MKFKTIEILDGDNWLTIQVSNDYPGTWENDIYYQRLTYFDAIKLAHDNDCELATAKIEDLCWEHANIRLPAFPSGPPYTSMDGQKAYQKISDKILEAFPVSKTCHGLPDLSEQDLAAGHKKVMVLSQKAIKAKKLAIYGWHGTSGKPIQGLSLAHSLDYSDYSQSARFVKNLMVLDGKEITYKEILKDPKLYKMVSNEKIIL